MSIHDARVVAEPEHVPLAPDQIERLARQRISASALDAFYLKDVSFQVTDRTLILRGRVPTVHMRQMLGSLLRGLDGVGELDNRVNVVSATGLSTTHPK
jgi:hypothetical protein